MTIRNILLSEQKYICIDNETFFNYNAPTMYINELYTICKYQNEWNKKIFYRIYDNKNEWKYSFDKDSPFEIRLKESFITLKEERKLKLDKINNAN